MKNLTIKEILGDWQLTGKIPGGDIEILFNSYSNANLVKEILEWEAAHPNEAIPYNRKDK